MHTIGPVIGQGGERVDQIVGVGRQVQCSGGLEQTNAESAPLGSADVTYDLIAFIDRNARTKIALQLAECLLDALVLEHLEGQRLCGIHEQCGHRKPL